MTGFEGFLSLLQCPLCGGGFSFAATVSPPDQGRYGILSCSCSRYPLIDDVPVLMRGSIGIISHWNDGAIHVGPTAQALVAALEAGASTEALLDCLAFPRKYPLQGRLTRAHLWPAPLGERAGLAQTRAGLRRLIGRQAKPVVAQDVFDFFYSRRSGNNPYLSEYFLNRFVMPRYLSAMSLVQRLEASDKPVLDIACGYGHFEHYLTQRRRSTPAIGIDFNFYQVWGARKWVAPQAQFVCCDASIPLPFKSGSCSGAICSDAFMLLPEKALLVAEVERVAPGRPAIYARVGNKGVGPPNPPNGGEMRPEEYWDLFGREQTRFFADDGLWKDYLMRRNPLEREPARLDDMRWEKYLSYVRHPQALPPQGEEAGAWCHGVGRLALNPVLSIAAELPDAIETEFMYRTVWGAYEDADMMSYTQRWARIEKARLREALNDPGSRAAGELIERFVLVGVPQGYIRDAFEGRLAAPI
jgi:SAM-dependent methyltransferase